jgi:DDE_Tnp_1-associated
MAEPPHLSLQTHFAVIADSLIDRTKRHQLLDIVIIALCGVICSADSWVEIEELGQAKQALGSDHPRVAHWDPLLRHRRAGLRRPRPGAV